MWTHQGAKVEGNLRSRFVHSLTICIISPELLTRAVNFIRGRQIPLLSAAFLMIFYRTIDTSG
jgi:hypothetical protein